MRVLMTGAAGQLGSYLLREARAQTVPVEAWSHARPGEAFGFSLRPVDLTRPELVAEAFAAARPDVVLHAAALSTVADCHRNPDRARQVNVEGTARLAGLADGAGVRLILVSTDLVFDGTKEWYREDDAPAPLSVYGRTKADAERVVLAVPRNLVARVSLLYGPTQSGRPAFFDEQARALKAGQPCRLFVDEWRTPLGLSTAARGLLALCRAGVTGLLHLGGPERLSRFEMGQRLAAYLGCDPAALVPTPRDSVAAPEPRPRDISLDASRWRQVSPDVPWLKLEDALDEMGGR